MTVSGKKSYNPITPPPIDAPAQAQAVNYVLSPIAAIRILS